ncbi:hypothetical protein MNBD_DELTA01-1511 [hydrothermal vent metagenome]|uniref:DUF2231 domain-containing protein n=1 Tax=hydrothermal vent metagenome TaxID=652676 RepID=A0A3B0RIP3_9ZZZZ
MEFFAGILPGILDLPNIHPLFVHFPIALLCGFLLLEALGAIMDKKCLRSTASAMLYLGTLATIVTFASGLAAAGSVGHDKIVHEVMTCHKSFALGVLILSIILSVWRIAVGERFSTFWRTIHFIVGIIMIVFLFMAADKGGTMVYKYGVGVQAVQTTGDHAHSGAEASDQQDDGHHAGGDTGAAHGH